MKIETYTLDGLRTGKPCNGAGPKENVVDELSAENLRLRAALEEIANTASFDAQDCPAIAHRALAQ